MPFNSLMMTCLTNKTSYGESGCDVTMIPDRGETVLLFLVDEQSNTKSNIRRALGMGKDEALCDCIYFYMRGEQKILCFVELKGTDLERAVEQVINTKNKLIQALKQATPSYQNPHQVFQCRAYVRLCRGAPQNAKAYIARLNKEFRLSDIKHESDISRFLRASAS